MRTPALAPLSNSQMVSNAPSRSGAFAPSRSSRSGAFDVQSLEATSCEMISTVNPKSAARVKRCRLKSTSSTSSRPPLKVHRRRRSTARQAASRALRRFPPLPDRATRQMDPPGCSASRQRREDCGLLLLRSSSSSTFWVSSRPRPAQLANVDPPTFCAIKPKDASMGIRPPPPNHF